MSGTPQTIEEAHAAGAAAGREGLGPLPPRDGPPDSQAHRLHKAYMQSYRDASVARVGIPERRRNARGASMKRKPAVWKRPRRKKSKGPKSATRGKTVTTTTRATVIRRQNPTSNVKRRMEAQRDRAARDGYPGAAERWQVWIDALPWVSQEAARALGDGGMPRRRANPAARGHVVLYATKPGMRRLKYIGRGKFGEKGRPMLFRDKAQARTAAHILKDMHSKALRGWILTAH